MKKKTLLSQLKNLSQKIKIDENFKIKTRWHLERLVRVSQIEKKPTFGFIFTQRVLVPALLALVLLFFGSAVTTALAEKSLPGEKLYPLKRLAERVRILLTQKPRARLRLRQEFLKRRFSELEKSISPKEEVTLRELKALAETELSLERLKKEVRIFKRGGLTRKEIRILISQLRRLGQKRGVKKKIIRQRLLWLEKRLSQIERSL